MHMYPEKHKGKRLPITYNSITDKIKNSKYVRNDLNVVKKRSQSHCSFKVKKGDLINELQNIVNVGATLETEKGKYFVRLTCKNYTDANDFVP